MRDAYLQTLVDNCGIVFEEMTGLKVTELQSRTAHGEASTFAVAQVIGFEEVDNHATGQFVLGFEQDESAIETASALARGMGLPEVTEVNAAARDLLNEFLNTIVGRAVSAWDEQGFSARFGPPRAATGAELQVGGATPGEVQLVRIFAGDTHVTLQTFFHAAGGTGRILVVDDSEPVRMIVTRALKGAGYEVEEATNGVEAVAQYGTMKPDLVVMDLVMPEMGGLDAAFEIRQADPDARILILTSSSRKDEVVTANTIGVSGYLIKPFKAPVLLVAVEKALSGETGIEH